MDTIARIVLRVVFVVFALFMFGYVGNAMARTVEVPVLMADGTKQVLTVDNVPDNVEIPICQQARKDLLVCMEIVDGVAKPLYIQLFQNDDEV